MAVKGKRGKIAVGHVILTRVRKADKSVRDVVLRPWQFSWANFGARPAIENYNAFIECTEAAMKCLDERLNGYDFEGADHYFADYIDMPSWAKDMTFIKKVGKHKFYKS